MAGEWGRYGRILILPEELKNHFPSAAGCVYSDDHGKTWETGFVTQGIENANETTAAEMENGKILFNFRNERYEKCRVMGIADETLTYLEKVWTEERSRILPVLGVWRAGKMVCIL